MNLARYRKLRAARRLQPSLFDEPAPVYDGKPVLVRVRTFTESRGEGVRMAGKVIDHPTRGRIFFHTTGTSRFQKATDCICPMDACVLSFLVAQGIAWVYSYDRERRFLSRAPVERILAAPQEVWDGRRRHYLEAGSWETVHGITEHLRGQGRDLRDRDGRTVLRVPFLRGREWLVEDEEM